MLEFIGVLALIAVIGGPAGFIIWFCLAAQDVFADKEEVSPRG